MTFRMFGKFEIAIHHIEIHYPPEDMNVPYSP